MSYTLHIVSSTRTYTPHIQRHVALRAQASSPVKKSLTQSNDRPAQGLDPRLAAAPSAEPRPAQLYSYIICRSVGYQLYFYIREASDTKA